MSLLSVPEQASSSSHVGVDDEGWEKLQGEMISDSDSKGLYGVYCCTEARGQSPEG